MNSKFFNTICETLGSQDRPVNERWKDVVYLNTGGQSVPVGELQSLIRDNKCWYVDKGEDNRYFLIMDYPYPEFSCRDVSQTITGFDIACLHSVTFKCPDNVVDIIDIINPLLGTNYDKPVKIKLQKTFFTNPDIDYNIPVEFNRPLDKDDFDIKWYNVNKPDEELPTKPKSIGNYILKVVCKNGYVGEASCEIRIDRI